MSFWIIGFMVVFYLAIGICVGYGFGEYLEKTGFYISDSIMVVIFCFGIFWPITLPVAGTFVLMKKHIDRIVYNLVSKAPKEDLIDTDR